MKLNVGDIFEFSINDNNSSYGQIIEIPNEESITIVVFEDQYKQRPLLDEIVDDEILLMGNTFDAKLYHGHWVIIGNYTSNLDSIKLPYYKIGTKPVYIEDFKGNKLRKAKKEEVEKLIYRPYVAPVRFELALKAHCKVVEWKEIYDDLLYSRAVSASEMIEK
jgi:hypothetical protein